MVFITENLIRKRAEHNEGELFSLEEVSLHQQDIEKIEFLDKWCRELKILYLQSNLIPKIENVNRLKKLEYLNLALNNIEVIENLEGCESLNKLDLTVNFIGLLTSVENLRDNNNLKELYLTGNPCTDYENYRQYVVATLPQICSLDGVEITKTERILALQNYDKISKRILEREKEFQLQREKQKAEYKKVSEQKLSENSDDQDFWNRHTEYTPESRIESHEKLKKNRDHNDKEKKTETKQPRQYIGEDGRILNCNEPKVDFKMLDDDDDCIMLDVSVYRHMDTSLIDVDVQPNYVRVTIKGKVLQLALPEEVNASLADAKRSQTTGHLMIKMPKTNKSSSSTLPTITKITQSNRLADKEEKSNEKISNNNYLEIGTKKVDYSQIVAQNNLKRTNRVQQKKTGNIDRENSTDFIDDPDVPPLV